MSDGKMYSAKEAAIAVLRKAEEMLKTSLLSNTKPKAEPAATDKDPVPMDTSLLSNTKKPQPKLTKSDEGDTKEVKSKVHHESGDEKSGTKITGMSVNGKPAYHVSAHHAGRAMWDSGGAVGHQGDLEAAKHYANIMHRHLKEHGEKASVDNAHEKASRLGKSEWKDLHADLSKMEDMFKSSGYPSERHAGQKGVHDVIPVHIKGKGVSHGHSSAGLMNLMDRAATKDGAKTPGDAAKSVHEDKLAELKAMPKPNLTKHDCALCKSQDLAKAETGHEKGVHGGGARRMTDGGWKDSGTSQAGLDARRAKDRREGLAPIMADVFAEGDKRGHKNKLKELKAMPKPNLTKGEGMNKMHKDVANAIPKTNAATNQPEKSDKAFEVEPKSAQSSNDARLGQTPAPENNPKEQAEGNNQEWGTAPGTKGHHKVAFFMGHMSAKRKNKTALPNG